MLWVFCIFAAMKAYIIRPTDFDFNSLEEIEIPTNKWEAMQTVRDIIGGYMEFCTCHINNEPWYILCDDNGKIKGYAPNMLATSIYDYRDTDCICGTVVLLDADNLLDFNNLF